jgi:hypothetical protein
VSHEEWELGLTFVLACGSAWLCLLGRCRGKGRPFSRRSVRYSMAVIGVTGGVSTAAELALLGIWQVLPGHVVAWLVGIAGPCGLYLERIRGEERQHGPARSIATFGLDRLLGQLDAAMADDRDQWCSDRIDPEWDADDLLKAAISYQDYLEDRLSDEDWTHYRIEAIVSDIEARLRIVRIINSPSGDPRRQRIRIGAELKKARLARHDRYEQYVEHPTVLGQRLLHDARRDMERMLSAAYCAGLGQLGAYMPRREAALEAAGAISPVTPHP